MIENEIDLHDKNLKTPEEIGYFVEKFIEESYQLGYKKIRIITGRGLHSTGKPLLKPHTESAIKHSKRVEDYRLVSSLGAFEILLLS